MRLKLDAGRPRRAGARGADQRGVTAGRRRLGTAPAPRARRSTTPTRSFAKNAAAKLSRASIAPGRDRAAASVARAQPMMAPAGGGMPNLARDRRRPLPDSGMPAGTVSVRVARRMPSNGVAGARGQRGHQERRRRDAQAHREDRRRRARRCSRGWPRATSSTPRSPSTARSWRPRPSPLPRTGGIRTMLIAALGSWRARRPRRRGARRQRGRRAGVHARAPRRASRADAACRRAPRRAPLRRERRAHPQSAGAAGDGRQVEQDRACATARATRQGVAHFPTCPAARATGYAAVLEWHGMRLGTAPFPMPESGGARAEIRALGRTARSRR